MGGGILGRGRRVFKNQEGIYERKGWIWESVRWDYAMVI